MSARDLMQRLRLIIAIWAIFLCAGCATQRIVPPLFSFPPQKGAPPEPQLLDVPTPPPPKSIPIMLTIPKKESRVSPENSIMRRGAIIKSGSSVVISVPASVYQRSQEVSSRGISSNLGFRTDGYFNVLEQYIERGLISVGLRVKDRSKFEAKLRDLRDSGNSIRSADNSYSIALASLQRELDGGKISRDEFAEKAKQLRDKLLDPSQGSRNREEMTDISEVIRAAQDGAVMADYVLQVNDLSVQHYAGAPLQLSLRPEIQTALHQNPGLRIGGEADSASTLPATLPQPWAQARFNAKLIDVKTGSIDWIGEYSIESLAVLEEGVSISIGVRRQTSNGKAIVDAISVYNTRVREAYQGCLNAKERLEKTYREVMQPVTYEGTAEQGEAIQNSRRHAVEQAERAYAQQLDSYRELIERQPKEARMDWSYEYVVDSPTVIPNLLNPKTELEEQRLLEHVKALGYKVTSDLFKTVNIE